MKICFPVQKDDGIESAVFGHFGSAPFFVVVDTDTNGLSTINNQDQHHTHGACNPMKALDNQKVDAIVVGGIGAGVAGLFRGALAPTVTPGIVLLSLGLDTNHGFAKVPVENSEVAKIRGVLERKLTKAQRVAEGARERMARTQTRSRQEDGQVKAHRAELVHLSTARSLLAQQQERPDLRLLARIAAKQEVAEATLAKAQQRKQRAEETSRAAFETCEHACCQQRTLLRKLEDLKQEERVMYELEHAKDQVMTVLKLALVNLVMWTRDTYFPPTYAHATWLRLAPFFRLPGQVIRSAETVEVRLRPFNDRQLNRDLGTVCTQVNAAQPYLPDGQRLQFRVQTHTTVSQVPIGNHSQS